MSKLTIERVEKEFPNAVTCIDGLLDFYCEEGYDRMSFLVAVLEGTMDLPDGELMTALCYAVMFERLLEFKKKEKGTQ